MRAVDGRDCRLLLSAALSCPVPKLGPAHLSDSSESHKANFYRKQVTKTDRNITTMKKNLSKIHPELREIADKTPEFLFSHKNLWLIKWVINLTPAPKTPEDILVENIFITGLDDRTKIRLRSYQPGSIKMPTPVLIWLHGGGYVMGKPEMDDLRCAQYARELGIICYFSGLSSRSKTSISCRPGR